MSAKTRIYILVSKTDDVSLSASTIRGQNYETEQKHTFNVKKGDITKKNATRAGLSNC